MWAAIAPAPGEQLGLRHLSHGIEGGESAVHSQSPPSIPAGAGIEPATFRLQAQLSNRQATTAPLRRLSVILIPCESLMSVICKVKIPLQMTYHILPNTEVLW